MQFREVYGVAQNPVAQSPVAPASRRLSGRRLAFPHRVLALTLSVSFLLQPLSAKTKPASNLDPGYLPALAAADHLLQAWQSGDLENGMALLTSHAKETATTDAIERFFSNSNLSNSGSAAYEIERGKPLKRGRYEFPVVLFSGSAKEHSRRLRFSSIVVVNTGNNDWAVDKLP
jgi:hypothetical protein